MKLTNLLAKNFMALGDVALEKLDTMGLTLLQGDNRDDTSADSNGAGKSSIVDAISWSLFGETARGVSGDDVVNDKIGKNCEVSVTLEDGGETYMVTRYRKHKTGKNGLVLQRVLPTGVEDLTKGTTDLTQKAVSTLLGCSAEVFNAAIYAGQDKMPDLPGMTDKNLKLVVEESAGVDRLARAYELARVKHRDAQAKLDIAVNGISAANIALTSAQTSLTTIEANAKQWAADYIANLRQRALEIKNARDSLIKLKDHISVAVQPARDAARTELAEVKTKIDGVAGETAQLALLTRKTNLANTEVTRAVERVRNAMTQVEKAKQHLAAVDHSEGQPCTECGKLYGSEDLNEARVRARARIDAQTHEARTLAAAAKVAQDTAGKLQAELDAFKLSMTDVSAYIVRERELNDEIRRADETIGGAERLAKDLAKMEAETAAKLKEQNPHTPSVTGAQAAVERAQEQLAKWKAEHDASQQALTLTSAACEVFGPAGVRGEVLDTVTPFLNDRTGHYLGVLSDGNVRASWSTITLTAKGDAREKFSIQVDNVNGAKTFAGLSGGEKRKVRLACAMALQDLVASRASKPISLFIADEIDHALDEAGLERLMTLLEEKAREKGTVMVVSHNSLRDWIRNVITVIKEGGRARVEVDAT